MSKQKVYDVGKKGAYLLMCFHCNVFVYGS